MCKRFLGNRIEIFRHETGLVSYSAVVYLAGLRVCLIPRHPWMIFFVSSRPEWLDFALHLHIGIGGFSVRLGDARRRSIDLDEVTSG